MPYLAKYVANYADEFYCEEFCIFNNFSEYIDFIRRIELIIESDDTEFYFGTNEYIEYVHIDELEKDIELIKISEDEATIFRNYFGKFRKNSRFGTGPLLDF